MLLRDVFILRLNLNRSDSVLLNSRIRWIIRNVIATGIFDKWILRMANQFVCSWGNLAVLFVIWSNWSGITQRTLISFTLWKRFIFLEYKFFNLIFYLHIVKIWDRFLIVRLQIVLIFFGARTQAKVSSSFSNWALLMPLSKSFNLVSSIIGILNAFSFKIVWAAIQDVLIFANLAFMFWWR